MVIPGLVIPGLRPSSARHRARRSSLAILAALAALALQPCLPAHADASDAAGQLHGVIAEYGTWLAEADPISAGQRGDLAAAARWPDDTPDAAGRRMAALAALQERLRPIPPAGLHGEDALNRDILEWRIATDLGARAFDEDRIPFTSDEGFFLVPGYAAESTMLRRPAEAEAWLARLAALPAYYEAEMANMRRGLRDGFVQPRSTALSAWHTTQAQAAVAAAQDGLLAPLDTLPATLPQDQRQSLRQRALDLIETRVKPAQRSLARFFETIYLPAARQSIAASALPDGRHYYEYLIRRETTTEMTPDAIMALGRAEIARIRAAMAVQMSQAGYHGDLRGFLDMLRHDPQFVAASPEALLERASRLAKRVDDQLPRLIGRLPRLSYGVRPVPAAVAEGYTSARYNPGSPEQGVAGGLMINTSHLDQRPLYELPALVAHEGAPGHHIQIALAQELDLPAFRRDMSITAYVEGWALYAEQLGSEIGLYSTPYERFGLLSMEMWRACRLVMDVGIHWDGWTREQALACLADNTALAPHNMASEVDRYIAWPAQALGYKIGELRILALRHRAETALGAKFDERAFHDVLLDEGAMPLPLLEARVDRWIAAAR